MTEEEKKAVEQYKNINFETYEYTCKNCAFEDEKREIYCSDCCETNKNIILNLIQKQEKEIQHWKKGMEIVDKDHKNYIQKQDTEINKLKQENHTLKEQGKMFIPRRRVRRVYKMLGKILKVDIDPVLLEKKIKSEERRGEYE